MLAMSAEHLRVIREKDPNKRLVWVDIGGGTGLSGCSCFLFVILITRH
jgi:hypothetical protein